MESSSTTQSAQSQQEEWLALAHQQFLRAGLGGGTWFGSVGEGQSGWVYDSVASD